MYIYSKSALSAKNGKYPMGILWLSYGYLMVRSLSLPYFVFSVIVFCRLFLHNYLHNSKKNCKFAPDFETAMIDTFIQTNWIQLLTKVLLATALGYLMGMEREMHGKAVGRRTISLIAIGSMLYVLMSPSIMGGDNSRVIAQVVSGIGFLGAGIIFKHGDTVRGLTTAATVWCAAAIGCLCGVGMFAEAIIGTAVVMIINLLFKHPAKKEQSDKGQSDKGQSDKGIREN